MFQSSHMYILDKSERVFVDFLLNYSSLLGVYFFSDTAHMLMCC